MLRPRMPSSDESEGPVVPHGLPDVIDAHVHVFPSGVFAAIWKWFDKHAWHIRYRMATAQVFDFLLSHGIKHIVALQYAHRPGIAGRLNAYMVDKCRQFKDRVTGMATVFPGEKNADVILQQAFDAGLAGLKLHVHVQCFDMNAAEMNGLYDCCRNNNKPMIIHAGREPRSPAYNCDPYQLCSAEKLENVLIDFPGLKICVPHLGFSEVAAYRKLIEKYDSLWLDTTMAITDYFPIEQKIALSDYRPDRVMYGSDFPNIPYAWDRELKVLQEACLPHDRLERITYRNALEFFS